MTVGELRRLIELEPRDSVIELEDGVEINSVQFVMRPKRHVVLSTEEPDNGEPDV